MIAEIGIATLGHLMPEPTHPQTEETELRMELALEGREGDRWRVRASISPAARPVYIDGATVALVDQHNRPLGPSVVLPVAGEISDQVDLYASIQGPAKLKPGSLLRCTAFFSGGHDQVCVEHVTPTRGFAGHVRGETALVLPDDEPEGRSLTDQELEALAAADPELVPEQHSTASYDEFKDDLLASMDLEQNDSVTEEILRMLKED